MSRRQLSLLVLAVASFVVTACGSSPTAPSKADPIVVIGSGG
jgi:outer membrane biogenesis lipoprotein LolB